MYLDYFSLDRHPFRITPDPSLFFEGGQDGRGVILNALIYAITSGEGILKVVGEVGSGKTMLCRMLEEKLPPSVEIVYLANPRLSAREILYAIAIELKLEVTAATERIKVMHMLQDYLLTRHGEGGTVVVFIEEAQSMPLETLEEIRLLSNLETHQHKLMQIVLFGQPELDKILAQKNIRQLRERITHSFRLEPLTAQATGDYLLHRLQAAGCPYGNIFAPRAVKLISRASSGLTRRINILADKSLLAAYADSPARQPAPDGDVPLVQPRHVRAAINDSDYKYARVKPWLWGSLAAISVVVGVIAFIAREPGQDSPATLPAMAVSADAETPAREITGQIAREVQEDRALAVAEPVPTPTPAAVQGDEGSGQVRTEPAPAPDIAPDIAPESAVLALTDSAPQTVPANNTPVVTDSPAPDGSEEEPLPATRQVTAPEQTAAVRQDAETPEKQAVAEVTDQAVAATAAAVQADVTSVLPSPVSVQPSGLAARRIQPTADWLRSLDGKSGYTIQLFSVPSTNPNGLEEYLQFLQLMSLLDDTYICFMPISSPTSGRWQVMHREFAGVTPARNLIAELPPYITQYGPYVSNITSIECSYPVDTRD